MDFKSPLVSIITPAYNHARFIGACIESVLAQDYQHWEQLIINDGSTDNTAGVIGHYSDSRIHYFEQSNQGIAGLARTYNRALAEARGEIIAILEGDDLWPAGKLSAMIPAFGDPEVALAWGDSQDVNESGELNKVAPRGYRRRASLPKKILCNDPIGSCTAYLLSVDGQSLITTSTVLIRRSALIHIGGFQDPPGVCPIDVPTFVELSRIGKFCYFPHVLGYRRRHFRSATLQFVDVMPTYARNFALKKMNLLGAAITPEERAWIAQSWRHVSASAAFARGRMCMLEHAWSEARRNFGSALQAPSFRVRAAAAAGWMLSWLHRDMEPVFRLAGRSTLSNS